MSSQTLSNESSSQASDSASKTSDCFQASSKPKRWRDQLTAWNFRFTLEADLSIIEGVDVDEQKKQIAEHLQTRMGHSQPLSVRSVTTFLDFKPVYVPPQDGSRSISIPILGFVQSKDRTVHVMKQWLSNAVREPAPSGLASDKIFGPCEMFELLLDYAPHIGRVGIEQSRQYCRSRQAKGILSVAVRHFYPSRLVTFVFV